MQKNSVYEYETKTNTFFIPSLNFPFFSPTNYASAEISKNLTVLTDILGGFVICLPACQKSGLVQISNIHSNVNNYLGVKNSFLGYKIRLTKVDTVNV